MNRIRIGIYLISQALKYHGTDKFWDVIGWWHGEVHYTIPRIREEKTIDMSLTKTFLPGDGFISTMGEISGDYSVNVENQFTYSHITSTSGSWSFGDWRLNCSKRPNFVRRVLISLVFGFKWEDSEEIERTKENRAEYLRLQEFLES
ncbi:MAG: hypothetical protein GY920_11465 [Aliivibrio sp.]|nr:hypothetical protein [Aliivibrio sp.]